MCSIKPFSFLAGFLLLAGLTACAAPAAVPSQPDTGSPDEGVMSPAEPAPPAGPGEPAPWMPAPGDELLDRGNVFIGEAQLLTLESFPPQFRLALKGNLPTPCHQLRIRIPEPDQTKRIQVEVYSLSKPEEICIQVLEPFEVSAPLEGLPSGHFTVDVNGEQVGEIDNP